MKTIIKLLKLNKNKLTEGEYYLIKNAEWSPSGFTVACLTNGLLICESCGRAIPFDDIQGIARLQ